MTTNYFLAWPYPKREVYPSDAELAEYLAQLRNNYDTDIQGRIINYLIPVLIKILIKDLESRPKRYGYGNKYADNK